MLFPKAAPCSFVEVRLNKMRSISRLQCLSFLNNKISNMNNVRPGLCIWLPLYLRTIWVQTTYE